MKIRLVGALLCGAALLSATQPGAYALERKSKKPAPAAGVYGGVHDPDLVGNIRKTTVKSSKSNTSDRMGGGGGQGGNAYVNPPAEPPGKAGARR